jgi:hypothetical protein
LALGRERSAPVEQVEAMLKQMRLRGLDENALRQFACKYSGRHWEEFYETLFGYEAKLQARMLWGRGERGRERPRWGAWRDPIVRAIEARLLARREMRERQLLAKIEAKALRAKGIRDDLARQQGRQNARALVGRAHKLRSTRSKRLAATLAPMEYASGDTVASVGEVSQTHGPRTVIITKDLALEGAIAAMLRGDALNAENASARRESIGEGDDEYERVHESWFKRRFGTPLDMILSPMIRLILAVIVLAGFTIWWKQNSGVRAARQAASVIDSRREIPIGGQLDDWKKTGKEVAQSAGQAMDAASNLDASHFNSSPNRGTALNRAAEPLGGWNAGLAGLLLLLSVFFTGRIMSVLVIDQRCWR